MVGDRSVTLSASGARILGMLAPRPWELGGGLISVSGRRVEWSPDYDGRILAQADARVGFPAMDRRRIEAAIHGHPLDHGPGRWRRVRSRVARRAGRR